jgi:hypothetical protein
MMRMIAVIVISFFTLTANASVESNLSSVIVNGIQQTKPHNLQNPFAIIYGGQDFSHPQIAIANEVIWPGRAMRIG